MAQTYEFTLPVSGKKITWTHYKMGVYFDLQATYRQETMKHLLNQALLSARIVTFDGKPIGETLVDIREWDEIDYYAFDEHVDGIDAQRRTAYAKDRPGGTTRARVENAFTQVQTACATLFRACELVRNEAIALGNAGAAPLAQGK